MPEGIGVDVIIVVVILVVVLAITALSVVVATRARPRDLMEMLPSEPEERDIAPRRLEPVETADEPPGDEPATAVAVEEAPPEPDTVIEVAPRRFFERLGKARAAFTGALASVFSRDRLSDEAWDDLEEALVGADVGVASTSAIMEGLRRRAKEEKLDSPSRLVDMLKEELKQRLAARDRSINLVSSEAGAPAVVLVTGVNGTGKTTTIGKLAYQQVKEGRDVVVAAGDTFRAAAAEQLGTWAERAGADLVRGQEGSDPAAVVFDAIEFARARGKDICIVDTAGRLHTKSNLMDELKKIARVVERSTGELTESLLVLDATTGQNGITQAREFTGAIGLSGVVLTKLDGSARGGVVLAIEEELEIPVKLVGLGEGIDDLASFEPDAFIEALFA